MDKNVNLNGLDDVKIQKLDWMNFELEDMEIFPDVVIAADVVYDPTVLSGLATTLQKLLHSSSSTEDNPIGYLACTVRNPTTLEEIKNLIYQNDLEIMDIFYWKKDFNGFASEKEPENSFEYEKFFPISEDSNSCFDVEILKIQKK
uniref:Uncharacterized protein n=1 Tax=Panagrolaimus sp. JU765 TaxID=591449 RepID=A0AC34RCV9_9BILA